MAHPNLVEPSELARHSVPGAFLQQFVPRAVMLKVSTAGALGTMAVQWKLAGVENYDPTPITSSAGATWDLELTTPGTHCVVTFAAGAYVTTSTYTVSEAGAVTRAGAGIDTVTATRYDLRTQAVEAATAEAIALMRNGITPPLTAWGADVKRHCAAIAHEFLRAAVGMTADGAGVGDQNVLTWAAAARAYFSDIGKSRFAPSDLVDSAAVSHGPILRDPTGDDLRGW